MSVFVGRVVWATGLLFGLLSAAGTIAPGQQMGAPEKSTYPASSIGAPNSSVTAAMAEPLPSEMSADSCTPLSSDPRVGGDAPGTAAGETSSIDAGVSAPTSNGMDPVLEDDKVKDAASQFPNAPEAEQGTTNVANANTPSNGSLKPSINGEPAGGEKQTKRILYMMPNFRSVDANVKLPPQTVKQKLQTATMDSLDYSSFIFYAFQSGIGWASNSYPEFHSGLPAYGRYYWHTLADSTSENYWVEFLIPSALHQDTRYYTMGKGSFPRRFVYAFTRTMLTRTDGGGETINSSEIVGAGAAAGIANLYYPSQERTFTKTYQRWVTNFVIDGGTFVFKEFWPDINNSFFHEQD